jgi:hypothetical protein
VRSSHRHLPGTRLPAQGGEPFSEEYSQGARGVEILAGLTVACLIVNAMFVAIKTLALWFRTRELPELLLSTMLFSVTVIGYPIALVCMWIPAKQFVPIHIAYTLTINGGFACLLFFTLRVFRPNVGWAKWIVGLTLAMLGASAVLYTTEVLGDDPRPLSELPGLGLLNIFAVAIAYFWTTFESLSYYRRLKLRLRIGLADAVVANRMLLWGLMTLSAGIAVVINTVALLQGSMMAPLIVALSSGLGLVHAGCLFFAFHSPAWYQSWIRQRSAVEVG